MTLFHRRSFALLIIFLPMLLMAYRTAFSANTPANAVASAPSTMPVLDQPSRTEGQGQDHGAATESFLGLFMILLLAKVGGDLMERMKQPAVLGELLLGVLFGNLALFDVSNGVILHLIEFLRSNDVLMVLAEIGVVLLLFQVGLESSVGEMAKVGISSFLVALLGVIAPFFLGWAVSAWFLPHENRLVHIFIAAVLCATSVGITARVLQDIHRIHTKEAKIILGAAVIDDVMGLIILAVVQGIIAAENKGIPLQMSSIFLIVGKASLFFIGSILIGVFFSPKMFRIASYLKTRGVLLSLSLMICFLFAWLAAMIGLAPIVGAFCAGLILEEASFKELGEYKRHDLEELIQPIVALLVPVFFVRMGVMVKLETFGQLEILGFALSLTGAAILGKQVCSLGVVQHGINRLAVGVGMIPRGEVGLIVASIGMTMVAKGQRVIEPGTYSAVVIMVIVTTLITPPLLTAVMRKIPDERQL